MPGVVADPGEDEYINFPDVSFPTPSEIDADLTAGLSTEDEAIEQLSRLQ